MEPYGFVFKKEFLLEKGAQPALYINSYGGRSELREAADRLFEISERVEFTGKVTRLLPFINAMHERYDFTWEREWRVGETLDFSLSKLICVILPEDSEDDIKEQLIKAGIAAISPGWSYERIVLELARQQRKTKVELKSLIGKPGGEKVASTL